MDWMDAPERQKWPKVLWVAPLVMLLAGAFGGWWFDDPPSNVRDGVVTGLELPTGDALDAAAPRRPVAPERNTMVFDRTKLVGYPEATGPQVPAGAAVPLIVSDQGEVTPVDADTLRPVVRNPVVLPPVEPTPLAEVTPPVPPPSTLALPAEGVLGTTTTAPPAVAAADPCVTDPASCDGVAGVVVRGVRGDDSALAPLTVSMPFVATGAFASMCDSIEGDTVPDPFLPVGTRPTVAVVVNQPSTIALTGTWDGGEPLDKTTFVTSAEFDQEWTSAWDDRHEQRLLLACVTLPLDVVRAHADAGRADLAIDVIAISAEGRADVRGPLALTVPLDGEDPPFGDQVSVQSVGEQREDDGTLGATVHVHYAITTDTVFDRTGSLSPATAKVYARHALVENADCAGWANNAQGLDRTAWSDVTLSSGQRTIAGRTHPVTVVDADLVLDQAQPGGWSGYACVEVFVADAAGNRVTVALRGAEVRSPLTATYAVGVVLTDPSLEDGWKVEAVWTRPDTTVWCGPVDLTPEAPGATCTTYARTMPDGVRLVLRAVDEGGEPRPALVAVVRVNSAYCNTDDDHASQSDGCSTGFVRALSLPTDPEADAAKGVTVTLQVLRTAGEGSIVNDPAHAWKVGPTRSFAF